MMKAELLDLRKIERKKSSQTLMVNVGTNLSDFENVDLHVVQNRFEKFSSGELSGIAGFFANFLRNNLLKKTISSK
jgi:hypothetical protein